MSVLLIAEHDNSKLKPFTFNAITAASKIDSDVHVLVAGTSCENVSKETANIPLVKKVLVCDSPNYQNYLPENLAPDSMMQFLATDYKYAVSFIILVIVLIIRPTGIFSGKTI